MAEPAASQKHKQGSRVMARTLPEERRAVILDLLGMQSKVLVSDLAERFGISSFTVRADLDELEREGKLRRCHGGALPLTKTTLVEDYARRAVTTSESKRAIGALAATLVEPGDSIIIDTGTTTIELARNLSGIENLTVVTNDLMIATVIEQVNPQAKLVFLGGMVRAGYHYTYGEPVLREIDHLHVDKAFLSANGFTLQEGFTSESYEQGMIKTAYAEAASERIALVDMTKFGTITFASFLPFDELDTIVTDMPFEKDDMQAILRLNEGLRFIS
ncbi:DeoR/GlpR family DNA-binding transcription regulator [Collinsella sp. AGMB00827]|uniref:DeoR/GlpR family DNA-binding transcription regulator n=1 Tax=Collinsella ureilytica TaxID=2869515 RepID=A0ABS7MMD4_9ACTN|nr:DeoR/GlpR family DNA-binding transcription regulator [Collinsella urealyticum]MBY4798231.1 DeoR/GlpR family DNA-binding transcription regulator [Collinsella urealyticum]